MCMRLSFTSSLIWKPFKHISFLSIKWSLSSSPDGIQIGVISRFDKSSNKTNKPFLKNIQTRHHAESIEYVTLNLTGHWKLFNAIHEPSSLFQSVKAYIPTSRRNRLAKFRSLYVSYPKLFVHVSSSTDWTKHWFLLTPGAYSSTKVSQYSFDKTPKHWFSRKPTSGDRSPVGSYNIHTSYILSPDPSCT